MLYHKSGLVSNDQFTLDTWSCIKDVVKGSSERQLMESKIDLVTTTASAFTRVCYLIQVIGGFDTRIHDPQRGYGRDIFGNSSSLFH